MKSIHEDMHQRALTSMNHAYGVYTNFSVGACILSENSKFYSGCNTQNIVLSLSQCAEENALASMINGGCRQIKEILVLASNNDICPPCGVCRQNFLEFANPDMKIHLADHNQILKSLTLEEMLPYTFTKNHVLA